MTRSRNERDWPAGGVWSPGVGRVDRAAGRAAGDGEPGRLLDGAVPLLLRPEVDAVDRAVGEPERPLVGVVLVFALDRLHRVGPRDRDAGRADDGEVIGLG